MTAEIMEKKTSKKEKSKKMEVDQLCKNYQKMDEIGKEKLKEVSVKILEIYNTVNDKKIENKK